MSEQLVTDTEQALHSHQFEDRFQQKEAATLGMWTFLATEVLFFGALFVSYAIYRHQWQNAFRQGTLDLKWYLGAFNTGVLLLSSFTMAMAVHSAALGLNKKVVRYLVLTILVGSCFLAIKGCEYFIDYEERLVPALNFSTKPPSPEEMNAGGRAFDRFDGWLNQYIKPVQKNNGSRPQAEQLYFLFYFIMTGIHATHMIVGICIMLVLIVMTRKGKFSAEYHNPIENFGLYWHFVDIVWVFLFPTLYLLRNP